MPFLAKPTCTSCATCYDSVIPVGTLSVLSDKEAMREPLFHSLAEFASVGDLLRFLRRRARLSQREFSIAVGYSESHISRIENNERPIDPSSLLALFVPALDIQDEPETIARLLALCAQAQPTPANSSTVSDLSHSSAESQPTNRNRLPAQLTSFIGRREETAELRDLLTYRETRLLTLTGVGGCGKTRLALHVGETVGQEYTHGVWLVELAPLADPKVLVKAAASVFNLSESADRSLLSTLTDFLHPRQALLILDNCEHLVDVAAHLAATLLQACPGCDSWQPAGRIWLSPARSTTRCSRCPCRRRFWGSAELGRCRRL